MSLMVADSGHGSGVVIGVKFARGKIVTVIVARDGNGAGTKVCVEDLVVYPPPQRSKSCL